MDSTPDATPAPLAPDAASPVDAVARAATEAPAAAAATTSANATGASPAVGGDAPRTKTLSKVVERATKALETLGEKAPAHPWWPGAVASLFLPALGLLFVRARTRLALGTFVAWIAGQVLLRLLLSWSTPVEGWQLIDGTATLTIVRGSVLWSTLLSILWWFYTLSAAVAAMLFTHDETVREYPRLGRPLLFTTALSLPPSLRS